MKIQLQRICTFSLLTIYLGACATRSFEAGEIASDSKEKGRACIGSRPNPLIPKWYRQIWFDIFHEKNEMAEKFMTRYQDCTGETYRLTKEEMVKIFPRVLFDGKYLEIWERVMRLNSEAEKTDSLPEGFELTESVLSSSPAGTLGNFWAHINGRVEFTRKPHENDEGDNWRIVGTVSFFDIWDFDEQKSLDPNKVVVGEKGGRDAPTNLRVKLANLFLPGKPFKIVSETANFVLTFPDRYFRIEGLSFPKTRTEYSPKGQALIRRIEEASAARTDGKFSLRQSAILMLGIARGLAEPPVRNSSLCVKSENYPPNREAQQKRMPGVSISGGTSDLPDYTADHLYNAPVNGRVRDVVYLSFYDFSVYANGRIGLESGQSPEVCFSGNFIPSSNLFEVVSLKET